VLGPEGREESSVKVRIEVLPGQPDIAPLLQDDGWSVTTEPDGSLSASHPAVADEAAARCRLEELGLLTAGSVRITFEP
jgi:hypothetical protein